MARLKIMARLDITERRKPQDGKIVARVGAKRLELRVATIPTVTGDEDVVLRLLSTGEPMTLDQLGLAPRVREEILKVAARPHGLMLSVGPTGSGKTTTLHSLMKILNDESRKIWTAEDPVEITQVGLRQVQMNPIAGLTFATALRAFLRADPDIIMVGEMRDLETARIGIEASLTGHLVFSTLHTNSAPETITRLLDMGLDPFMFSDALQGILAQRLARRVCGRCKETYVPSKEEAELVTRALGEEILDEVLGDRPLRLWRGVGCVHCEGRGYRGRLGVHELLVASDEIRDAIARHEPLTTIRELGFKSGMRTLLQDGLVKCLQGHSDLKQVVQVCGV